VISANSKIGFAVIQRLLIRNGDLVFASFLVAFAFYAGSNIFSPVRFDREKIEIRSGDGRIQVHGVYHYRNRFPLPLTFSLGLPFPMDATHLAPSDYSVSECLADGTAGQEIRTHKYHGNVVFRLWFAPSQEKWIRVDYTQPLMVSNARYILLTTQKWQRPLDSGEYILHLDEGNELVMSNYPTHKSEDAGGRTLSFTKSNFFPQEDWIFSWKPVESLVASKREPK
jgi:hypothetical protein